MAMTRFEFVVSSVHVRNLSARGRKMVTSLMVVNETFETFKASYSSKTNEFILFKFSGFVGGCTLPQREKLGKPVIG